MGTDRGSKQPYMTRPVKGTGDRKRRVKVQKKRLAAMGVADEKLRVMNTKQIRTLLRKPKVTAKRIALGRI